MIPISIQKRLENDPDIRNMLSVKNYGRDWSEFSRTVFEHIAKIINRKVTECVLADTKLINDFVIIGPDELETVLFKNNWDDSDKFIDYLKNLKSYKVYNWVSGKTLHSYWQGGNAKNKKINVLLVFLGTDYAEWEKLKLQKPEEQKESPVSNQILTTIKKYYLGKYYLYYQKTDSSKTVVRSPFSIILDKSGNVSIETETEGQRYKSIFTELMQGCLCVMCKHVEREKSEYHIFNVGFETKPEIIFGVSNTISIKRQVGIAIRSVLIKQNPLSDEPADIEDEFDFDAEVPADSDEFPTLAYFREKSEGKTHNLILTDHPMSRKLFRQTYAQKAN